MVSPIWSTAWWTSVKRSSSFGLKWPTMKVWFGRVSLMWRRNAAKAGEANRIVARNQRDSSFFLLLLFSFPFLIHLTRNKEQHDVSYVSHSKWNKTRKQIHHFRRRKQSDGYRRNTREPQRNSSIREWNSSSALPRRCAVDLGQVTTFELVFSSTSLI